MHILYTYAMWQACKKKADTIIQRLQQPTLFLHSVVEYRHTGDPELPSLSKPLKVNQCPCMIKQQVDFTFGSSSSWYLPCLHSFTTPFSHQVKKNTHDFHIMWLMPLLLRWVFGDWPLMPSSAGTWPIQHFLHCKAQAHQFTEEPLQMLGNYVG